MGDTVSRSKESSVLQNAFNKTTAYTQMGLVKGYYEQEHRRYVEESADVPGPSIYLKLSPSFNV